MVAPLFESEISTDLLLLYHCHGCEIFAVTADLSEDQKDLDSNTVQRLRNFCGTKKRSVVYCSPLISTSPGSLFVGQSFMWINSSQVARSNISAYEPSETLLGEIDLNEIKDNTNYNDITLSPGSYKLSSVELAYNCKRKNIKLPSVAFDPKRRNAEPTVLREAPKYYLWSLFKKANKGTPFYVSSLLTKHNATIIHLIDRIASEISGCHLPVFEGDGSYATVLSRMLRICDYTITTEFDPNKH